MARFSDRLLDYILILWRSYDEIYPGITNYYFKKFDFDLNSQTGDINIYGYIDVPTSFLDGALISSSRLMAVWEDHTGYWPEIYAKTIDVDGSNPSEIFITHVYRDGHYKTPSISSIMGGGAIVVWGNTDGIYETSIWGRRFDYNGAPIDMVELLLSIPDSDSNGTFELQSSPIASQNSQGNFAVSWKQIYSDMLGVFKPMVRFFDNNLMPISDTIKINDLNGNVNFTANLFMDDDNLLVCWSEDIDDYYDYDILGNIITRASTKISSIEVAIPGIFSTAYPNPFNSTTTIKFTLKNDSRVLIKIYDVLGRKVKMLTDEYVQAGNHQIGFNVAGLPSGTYFYRIKTNQFTVSKKLTLLK